jgi:hypothetical protein
MSISCDCPDLGPVNDDGSIKKNKEMIKELSIP